MNLALTHAFWLQKSDYRANLKLGMVFNDTGLFLIPLKSLDMLMKSNENEAVTSPLPEVSIYASDIENSRSGYV